MLDVVGIDRKIADDKVTVIISVFLNSGIVQREYKARLSYAQASEYGLPYISYHAVFDNISGAQVDIHGTSPEIILHRALMAVKEDARRFASNVLKNAGKKSSLNWPIYGFSGEKTRVSSY